MKVLVPAALALTCIGLYLSNFAGVESFIVAGSARAALGGGNVSNPVRLSNAVRTTGSRVECRMTSGAFKGEEKPTKGFGQPKASVKPSDKKKGKTHKEETGPTSTGDSVKKGNERRQLYLQFECNRCNGVSQYMISRQAYENGIVICTCQKCGVRHLLADNLKKMDVPSFGNNIEEYMQSIGSPEEVTKGTAPGLTPEMLEKFDVSVGADGVLNLSPKVDSE